MLQCLLSYPHLVSEFSHSIEEKFLSSTHPAAERIIEVWRAAAAEDEEGGCVNPASLLMRLGESASLSYYEELLTEELSTGTPEEGARLEVRKAFIELERTKARIEMLAHDAARDMDAMRRLNDRRAELQRLADEARLAEREYRLRIENQARFESQRAAEKPWGGESAPFRPIRDRRAATALPQGRHGDFFRLGRAGRASGSLPCFRKGGSGSKRPRAYRGRVRRLCGEPAA